jgi:hypothetical protein
MSLDYLAAIGGPRRSREADVLLAAIKYQESDGVHTHQKGGPARGLWQFEKITITELFRVYRSFLNALCAHHGVVNDTNSVYVALASNDELAISLSRLLLYKDKTPLPHVGNVEEAWKCYLRNWRPGKPRKEKWFSNYQRALKEQ